VEIEWQFDAFDLRPVERWLSAVPAVAVDTAAPMTFTALARTPQRMNDTYLDTEDWRLARAGFVLCTRRRGRADEITLKDTRPAAADGLRQRMELTEVLPEAGVAALGTEGPVGRRVHAVAGRMPLRPVLHVRTRRRPFALRVGGVDAAEIALDDTLITAGGGQRPTQLRRVEVEALPTWTGTLGPLMTQLRTACGLQPAALSKFEAGLLALGIEIPGPPDLGPTDVQPDASMGELAFAVLRRQLAVLRAKEPGTRLGEDIEELHDMRVATRRLRAAVDLFVDVLPLRARIFRTELTWLAGVLGAVRDLDVQLHALEVMAAPSVDDPWADLVALLSEEREAARRRLLSALDSMRWERLQRDLETMAHQGPLLRSVAARVPATVAVPNLIDARHTTVVKAARRARRSGEAADFHRLRLRCKRLRYSLEFSADLYGGRTSPFTKQLTGLQNDLGLFQDAEVAAARLAALATGEARLPAATIFMMGGVAERHRWALEKILRTLPSKVRRVGGNEWRNLAALMDEVRAETLAQTAPVRRTLHALPTLSDTGHESGGAGPDPAFCTDPAEGAALASVTELPVAAPAGVSATVNPDTAGVPLVSPAPSVVVHHPATTAAASGGAGSSAVATRVPTTALMLMADAVVRIVPRVAVGAAAMSNGNGHAPSNGHGHGNGNGHLTTGPPVRLPDERAALFRPWGADPVLP
jgi:CHAD domain-containing protein